MGSDVDSFRTEKHRFQLPAGAAGWGGQRSERDSKCAEYVTDSLLLRLARASTPLTGQESNTLHKAQAHHY